MPSPYDDVSSRTTSALRVNPTAVAGLSEFEEQPGDLRTSLDGLSQCVRSGLWQRHKDAGATLYAMIRVAQEFYDGSYWPHLARELRCELPQTSQGRLGEWFADALGHFGYEINVPGELRNVSPVLWHAGWSQSQLQPLLGFVAGQVAVYGARAAEPDAPHALRLGPAAEGWSPRLPLTVIRLLGGGAFGVGDLWARLAGAVLALRRGPAAVRNSWEPIGGITASDILASMPDVPQASAAVACPRRPRLRYHPDTGELRLWLIDGKASDWRVDGLRLAWQGGSAELLPPIPARFTLTYRPTSSVWAEVLFAGDKPAAWFGGRSGVLERGDEVTTQGLSAGRYYLVCRGIPAGLPPDARCPLPLGYYAGGEGWAAWEVDVPARSGPTGASSYALRVDGADWRFPLARGAAPLLRVDGGAVAQGEFRNKMGDAHGKGPVEPLADPLQAELAVTTAGAMATFFLNVWESRRPSSST